MVAFCYAEGRFYKHANSQTCFVFLIVTLNKTSKAYIITAAVSPVPSRLINPFMLMVSVSVVSPCGVLFTQGLRLPPTAFHRLWQHRIHHLQPILLLLWTWVAATCWLSRVPVPGGRGQPCPLLLARGRQREWAQPSSSSSVSPLSRSCSLERSTSSKWVDRLWFISDWLLKSVKLSVKNARTNHGCPMNLK